MKPWRAKCPRFIRRRLARAGALLSHLFAGRASGTKNNCFCVRSAYLSHSLFIAAIFRLRSV